MLELLLVLSEERLKVRLVYQCGTLEIGFDERPALIKTTASAQITYLSLGEGEEEQEEGLDLPVEREPVRFMLLARERMPRKRLTDAR